MYIRTLPIKNDLHAVCELKLNIRAFFIHPFTGFTAPLSYDHPEKKSKIKFLQLFFFFLDFNSQATATSIWPCTYSSQVTFP